MNYVVNYLSAALGTSMKIVVDTGFTGESTIFSTNNPKCVLHYGSKTVDGIFNVFAHGLLFETSIRQQEPDVFKQSGQFLLYTAPSGFDLPFDPFSAVFYLLSRYEEYNPYKPDRYGRFEADQSLAYRHDFLEEPVVDQWVQLFGNALKLRFPKLTITTHEFCYVSTFDVDNPWAFLNRGFFRTAGGILKEAINLNIRTLRVRLKVLSGKCADPYDNYDYIRQTEQKFGFKSLFFFLAGDYGGKDVNYALRTSRFKDLLDELKSDHTIGIHPSFKSNRNRVLLNEELARFSRILGKMPEISRQHFLMISFPHTYRQLISVGIQGDYSMGYASRIGFRAGTSKAFRFYDLQNEQETSFTIHPFLVMDVTLKQYLNHTPDEALERITGLVEKIRAVNGTFTSLWHNESLSEQGVWKGWRRVWEGMVKNSCGF